MNLSFPSHQPSLRISGLCLVLVFALLASCASKDEAYTFDSDRVGPINRATDFDQIAELFPGDSVVRDTVELQLGVPYFNYNVYRSPDSLLLVVSPHRDSIGRVGTIRIVNGLYTTKKGLGPGSTLGEFSEAFELGKVQPGVFRIGVGLKNEKFQLLIPRSELPEGLRMAASDVDLVQIPEDARVEFITISW